MLLLLQRIAYTDACSDLRLYVTLKTVVLQFVLLFSFDASNYV